VNKIYVAVAAVTTWLLALTIIVARLPAGGIGDANFGARGPASISGLDAGSYPQIVLPNAIFGRDISAEDGGQRVNTSANGAVSFADSGTITVASASTSAAFVQAPTATGNGANGLIQPQPSTKDGGTSGWEIVALTPPVGVGSEDFFCVDRPKGTHYACFGGLVSGPAASYAAVYLGPNITPNGSNNVLQCNPGETFCLLNSASGAVGMSVGGTPVFRGTPANSEVATATNYAIAVGSTAGSYGGGAGGMVFITTAATSPTTSITGGGVIYVDHSSGNLYYIGGSGTPRLLALN
jgi:hypothetical protein